MSKLFLQLEKGNFIPGEQVNGFLNLNAVNLNPPNCIWLSIMGIEKTRFIITKTVKRSEFDKEVKQVPSNLIEHFDNHNGSSSSSSINH